MKKIKEISLLYALIALGISSLISQIIYIREFLNVFFGNELIFGIILASWMILTAGGAFLGKFAIKIKNEIKSILFLQLLLAVFPLITVFLLRWFRNDFFPIGSMLNIPDGILMSLLFLAPYCLVSGFLFTFFCISLSRKLNNNEISRVYYFDTIGCIIGGFLFNFILVFLLNSLQILYVLLFINLSAALFISVVYKRKKTLFLLITLFIGFVITTFTLDLEKITKEKQFKGQDLVFYKDTPYGNLVVTRNENQFNFFDNSKFLFSTENTIENEEAVHFAMLQHKNPKKVLLLSGGVNGLTKEMMKYKVEYITYLEINPVLVELGKKFTTNLSSSKIRIIYEDARYFINRTKEKFDVVIIALPEPTTAQLNRFYTLEFYKELKKILNTNAVVSFGLLSSNEYLSAEVKNINSVIYNTLNKVFKNIIILPGNRNYFVASDGILSSEIVKLASNNNLNNAYVNAFYLSDNDLKNKMLSVMKNVTFKTEINRDFKPIVYYHQLKYWMSHFKTNYYLIFGVLIILLLLFLYRLKPINLCLFTGGFAASSIEVILLVTFQVVYGYVYQMIGIIIMLFMVGLALGIYCMNFITKKYTVNNYLKIQAGLVFYSVCLPFVLLFINYINPNPVIVQVAYCILILIIGGLTGMTFSLSSKIIKKDISSVAAETYGADLFGSAIGAIVLSAFLLPLLGVLKVCLLIGLFNLASGLNLYVKRNSYQ